MSLIEPIVPTIWQRYRPWILIAGLLIAIALIIAAVEASAQTPHVSTIPPIKNLENFKEIGRDELIVYYINYENAVRTPIGAVVETLAANYQNAPTPEDPEAFQLNNQAYILTIWRIDCSGRFGQRLEDSGIWKGKKVHKTFRKPKPDKPTKDRNLYAIIEAICGVEVPINDAQTTSKAVYEWKGGNGCNLIGGGVNERLCCVEHDFSYRTGGNLRDKWQADSNLFKCIWKRNKFLAPLVFVGTNVGGIFAFHWGRKRELKR